MAVVQNKKALAQRMRTSLRHLGYWKGDRPDVGRFCRERGYLPQSVYSWLRGVEPKHESLRRLAADLECTIEWLVSGEEARREVRRVVNLAPTPIGVHPSSDRGPAGPRAVSHKGVAQIFDAAPIRNLREVTERLERMEAALQAFFDTYPDLLVWMDHDGTVLSVSHGREFEPMLPPGSQIGKKKWEVLPPETARRWKEALAQVKATGEPYVFEDKVTVKGRLRNRECRLVAVKDHGFLAIIRDITELRELQEKAYGPKKAE